MYKNCKICGEIISIKEIKLQAKGDQNRTKNIKKDYYICRAMRYCITCIRAKQQMNNPLEEIRNHPAELKKAFKNERQLRKTLKKKGLTEEQINSELPKFKAQIK